MQQKNIYIPLKKYRLEYMRGFNIRVWLRKYFLYACEGTFVLDCVTNWKSLKEIKSLLKRIPYFKQESSQCKLLGRVQGFLLQFFRLSSLSISQSQ